MKLENILQNANYWYKNAFETEHFRKPVFLEILSSFNSKPINILEIGATGGDMHDLNYIHGAGGSSFYFAEYVRQNGGSLIIVDVNPLNIKNCKTMLEDFIKVGTNIEFICDHGLNYIRGNNNFELIYLDGPDDEKFTFESFKLIDRYKTKVLCDDANGFERGKGKCVSLIKNYSDYTFHPCGTVHKMLSYDIIKEH